MESLHLGELGHSQALGDRGTAYNDRLAFTYELFQGVLGCVLGLEDLYRLSALFVENDRYEKNNTYER
jgi:hypothetical protein